MDGLHIIDRGNLQRDPAQEGALKDGRLQVLPHAFWQQFNQSEISAFCVAHGFYCIPTTELIDWLSARIAGRKAIEIGAGSGVLSDALGIIGTDNKMQEWPHIRQHYQAIQQAPVLYGANVQQLDAQVAIDRHKPAVVVAAWVTHRYDQKAHWRGGNAYGVDICKAIKRVQEYIHVGNRYTHRLSPAMDLPHEEFEFPWLISRAMNNEPNFICSWMKP